jgi:hypothetical protein
MVRAALVLTMIATSAFEPLHGAALPVRRVLVKCEDEPDAAVITSSGTSPLFHRRFVWVAHADGLVLGRIGGLLPSCEAAGAMCQLDPHVTEACPLSCGVCTPMQAATDSLGPSNCTVDELLAVARGPTQLDGLLRDMRETNGACARCLAPCKVDIDKNRCISSCLPRRAHLCDVTTGLARIADLIEQARLDSDTLTRILDLAEAECSYCILETFEFVGGQGFVRHHLHMTANFDIEPWPCLPQLADKLATAQATVVRNLTRSAVPFGITAAPWTNLTDVYVPSGEWLHNAVVYRGMHYPRTFLYRCEGDFAEGGEIWAVTMVKDPDSWIRCEGRLWINMETSQVTDQSMTAGGAYFGYDMELCSQTWATEHSKTFFESYDTNGSSTVLTFVEGVSEVQVACTLLWKHGLYAPPHPATTTVQLPSGIGSIELKGDVAAHSGTYLTLQGAGSTLVVAGRQLHVAKGGRLQLVGITLEGSNGGPGVSIEGEFTAVNCTFADFVASNNVILGPLQATSFGVGGSEENPPIQPIARLSVGGAVHLQTQGLACELIGCTFVGNFVRGSRFGNFGGAVWAEGGRIVVQGTQMRQNGAAGSFGSGGGAMGATSSRQFDVVDSAFTANELGRPFEARDGSLIDSFLAAGGAIYVKGTRLTVKSSRFDANVVRDATYQSTGGAIFCHEAADAVVSDSWFLNNRAIAGGSRAFGGAISVAPFATMRISMSLIEGNVVSGDSYCRGGGLSVAGSIVLHAGVILRSNAVLGLTEAVGGAIDVALQGVLTSVHATLFRNNTVRSAFVLPQL